MTAPPANAPLLHRLLGIGLVLLAAVFFVLTIVASHRSCGRQQPCADCVHVVRVGRRAGAVALLFFKPRVPERRPEQLVEKFWSMPEVSAKVSLVWFLMEGAGVLAGVGYLLTGEPVTALVMALAIVAFWLCGPNAFAKE